jgi:hypothetical protein
MFHNPRLDATIPLRALCSIARAARGEVPDAVAEDRAAPGLVEGDPMADLGAHGREDDTRVADVVGDEIVLVEETAVASVERLGKIPVEERDHGDDAGGEEVVDEGDVEVEAFFVDGIMRPPRGMMRDLCGEGVTPDLKVFANKRSPDNEKR